MGKMTLSQVAYAALLLLALSALTSIGAGAVALYLALALTMISFKLGFLKVEADPGFRDAIIFFLASMLITCLFSYDPAFSLKRVLTVTTRFVPVFLAVALLKDPKQMRGMVLALAISTVIADSYAFLQWSKGIERVYSFDNHPIVFAALLIQVIPLMIAAAFSGLFDTKIKAALLGLCGVSIVALIMTGTRGAWLAAIGMILVYILVNLRNKFKLAVVVLLLVGIAVSAAGAALPGVKDRLLTGVDINHDSNFERLLMWQSAWRMFIDHPLTGVGLGMYSDIEKAKYLSPLAKDPDVHMHAHNTYLNFLAETGIIGFVSFAYLFGYILYSNYKRFRKNPTDVWVLAMLLVTVGFLIQGFTEYNFGHLLVLRLFTLLAGICLIGSRITAGNVDTSR